MKRVYISNNIADREFASQIERELQSLGYEIPSTILSDGESLSGAVAAEMSKADIVVFIYSEAARESTFVNYELGLAKSFSTKLVIPILLDGIEPPDRFKDLLHLKASSNDIDSVIPYIQRSLKIYSDQRIQSQTLLVSTFISFFIALLSTLLAAYGLPSVTGGALTSFTKIHWTVWVCLFPALYGVLCYVNDILPITSRVYKSVVTVPYWTQLRGFGDKRIARISYVAIAIIPIIAYAISENPFQLKILSNLTIPLGFRLTFFASWFFAIALILFVAGCPKEYRRQQPIENAKTVNLFLHESPGANVKMDSPAEVEDVALDSRALELRAACFLFYLLGIAVAAIIMVRAAWFVIQA